MCELTLSTTTLLKISGGELLRVLFENIMSFDFLALKVTFQMSDQADIFAKSLFNCAAVSVGSMPEANRVVSSANIRISDSISFTMSFIKIMKSNGPRRETCGTPASVSIRLDLTPSI